MAEEVQVSFLGKLAEILVDPIVCQCCYLFQYRSNIKNLKDELDGLQASKEGVKIQVNAAGYNLEIVDPAMQSWVKKVNEIETKASTIIERTSNVDKKCFNVWCPNVKCRYLLSRNATKVTRGIGKLKLEGKIYSKSTHSAPPPGIMTADALLPELATRIDATPSIRSCEDLESRKSTFKQVMDALENDRIRMIGISGIGGVGKTTFVNEVCQKARAQNLFKELAMTAVSQKQELLKIQDELAEMLGLKFMEEKTLQARALRLRSRLTDGRKILVILDDVWEEIPLKQVGIPVIGDRGGCKVMFTSRDKHLFSDMGTQLNVTIEALTRPESWELFEENIGDYNRHFAIQIVDNCKGIPIAIVTLAKALRKEEAATWDYALNQLKQSRGTKISGVIEDAAYKSVKLSYNLLKDSEAKTLLVLCCLFQEDTNISLETLVGVSSRRSNVSNSVGKLRSCNLLGEGNLPGTVKVHDIVRDVCLTTEGLDKWPQNLSLADQSSAELENGGLKSRKSTYKELWDALNDDQIHTIGIHGMAGVGKTKMVQDIREKVRAHNLFDEVAMTTVSLRNNMHNVQAKLGQMLGLSMEDNHNITMRAELLHERLTNGGKILIILDDVWENLDLQDIGIPNRGVIWECKVIITTRIEKVCREMGIQKKVELGLLSDEEAWNLFKDHAGLLEETSETSNFYSIGREIVSECGSLPSAVVEIASTLKNVRFTKWVHALEKLRDSSTETINGKELEFHLSLQMSFNCLEDPRAQLLLLLCCVMGANTDIPIEKLVICVNRVQLFGDSLNLEEIQIKVRYLVDLLRSASLLLTNDRDGTVRMHHVVRRMCLSLLAN